MDFELILNYLAKVFSFDPNTPLLFTQFQFWVFFAIVFFGFALIASVPSKRMPLLRNAYLFLFSLLFYYKTSGLFVGLLILVTCTDFLIAQLIYAQRDKALWQRRALDRKSVV